MRRDQLVGVMVNKVEHELLSRLARVERRTMSDLVRLLVHERACELGLVEVQSDELRPGRRPDRQTAA